MTPGEGWPALLLHGAPHEPVCESLTRGQLRARAMRLAALLPEASATSEISFSFGDDYAACAVALCATWLRGHTAALPVDGRRDNVVPVLGRPASVGFLHDTGVGRGFDVARLAGALEGEFERGYDCVRSGSEGARAARWPDGKPAVALFAHGEATPCRALTPAEVDAEARHTAETLELTAGRRVASTLTPTEPTALFAALLAPLVARAQFGARRIAVEAVVDGVRACAFDVLLLAEAHRRRLGEWAASLGLREPREPRERRELLELGDSRAVRARVVAPAPTSPEAAALEAALLARSDVRDVAVRDIAGPTGRQLLAAVVTDGAPYGSLRCAAEALSPLTVALSVVPELDRDDNGTLVPAAHHLLFGLGRDGRPVTRDLEWRAPTRAPHTHDDPREWVFQVRVPERYALYEGHFAGYPILAGAVQLQRLVLPCLERTSAQGRTVQTWPSLKFLARIEPGDDLEVVVSRDEGDPAPGGAFEVRRDGTRCSIGRFRFASGR